ncbi:TIGR02391 family protein [Patescibacteria group bacterium]|nr:TIGR02391 family protein [Patescibacteria group bacterium]
MMNGKQKLYFLLDAIEDASVLAPSGQPLIIDPTNDLNRKYTGIELQQLFAKLENDLKVLKVLQVPSRFQTIEIVDDPFVYQPEPETNDGTYRIELLPAFVEYFTQIQSEPEYQDFTGKTSTKRKPQSTPDLSVLHQEIYNKCHSLFEKEEYPEAVEKGFKVVRDRLRVLTGHETGSKAFGNTKLHIKGAVAQNVDHDFNEGVKFLTMAIDMFRNEKSHTSDAKIDDPQRAYEYLSLSSLAMNLLDQAEIITT